ncbi:MAG: hypothetical protein HDQ96_09415 [Lachnospiraceae bacterium]|nr:hypothetical protein [Lachnospiraceae bacterium]
MQDKKRISIFFKENRKRLWLAAVFGCLPLLLCILYCTAYGGSLSNVYLPASYWNDELFYYKQTEGILRAGYPWGYFGFNESYARVCSFGVWNPLLFFPWVVWGLFQWGLYAPILCNLVCATVGMVVFAWLARPKRGQALSVLVLVSVLTPFPRFILSSVAEAFLMSMILVYMGLSYAYAREKKNRYFNLILCLTTFLTIMRPYFCLLTLWTGLSFSKRNIRECLKPVGSAGLGLAGYYLMNYWLSAPYLFQHIAGGFIEVMRQEGMVEGIRAFNTQTWEAILSLFQLLKGALRYGLQGGCLYGVFGLLGVTFLLIMWQEHRKGHREGVRQAAGIAFVFTIMMAAVVYMYNIHNGDRHLLTFILLGILFLGMYSDGKLSVGLKIFLTMVMAFFFLIRPGVDYDRSVPFEEETLKLEIDELTEILESRMKLSDGLSWDNTVIWLAYDIVDGEIVTEQWQQLYALPAGFGINYCSQTYVMEHFNDIRSRYIAAVPGGEVEEKLMERGAMFLGGNKNISIWDRSVMK